MNYDEMVKKILKEVEHILKDEAALSQGANIEIEIGSDRITTITYEIKDKAVV